MQYLYRNDMKGKKMESEKLQNLIVRLNHDNKNERLTALKEIKLRIDTGHIQREQVLNDVNSHIHTFYSFSPYSPSAAVFSSWQAGLVTTGIMDHDSISGAEEFIEAGKILGMPTTIGSELRVNFAGTKLDGKKINNPDQDTIAYVALHGVPHTSIDSLKEFFRPVLKARESRNRKMTAKINKILEKADITIDYDSDVLPLSKHEEGGSVTERHLLFAVSKKITEKIGRGKSVISFLKENTGIEVKGKAEEYLLDEKNEIYDYDLLNVLKGNMVEKFYIPATEEALSVGEVSEFAEKHGIVLAYAYLGDVTESVTGDKKSQKFEDDYIDDLFETIKGFGFKAVTYMPSRNTPEQLEKLRFLCNKHDFFQISGEDINQPRQKFVCEAMRKPEFSNLYDSAWALIGHEWSETKSSGSGMFSDETIRRYPDLNERISLFRDYAKKMFKNS